MVGYGPFDSNLGVYRMNMGFSRLLRHPMKKGRELSNRRRESCTFFPTYIMHTKVPSLETSHRKSRGNVYFLLALPQN